MAELVLEPFPEGERVVVEHEGKEIGVYHHEGEYYAYLNWCPHMSGPCCEGQVSTRRSASFDRDSLETAVEWEGSAINCPWHGWQFDIESGECLSRDEPHNDLLSFPVVVEDDEVRVET